MSFLSFLILMLTVSKSLTLYCYVCTKTDVINQQRISGTIVGHSSCLLFLLCKFQAKKELLAKNIIDDYIINIQA